MIQVIRQNPQALENHPMESTADNGWIHRLLRPSVYPHATAQQLHLLETHISWIILTGEFAYKIKKPVSFGFVDFSTLERRESACRDEVRLNRRWSDTIYLDVCPLTGNHELPRMGGGGRPFEFAVKMRQFDQQSLLSRCIVEDRLQADHLERFARDLAQFHQRTAGDPGPELGTPAAIRDPVMHNFDPLFESDLPGPDRRLATRLQAFSEGWIDGHLDVLEQRHDQGYVRECHGDLHLNNMLLLNDRIELFDCLEFNAALRWVDVMSEIAFLVMDLENHGRPELARCFLNAYIEHSGDHAGLAVLPFYIAYRAVVRAKVDQLNRVQQGQDPQIRMELLRELESYLDEAAIYARDTRPRLAVMSGVSGTGKTHHSQQFVDAGFIRIRSDFERKRLAGSPLDLPVQGPSPPSEPLSTHELYGEEFTARTYRELARRAELCLAAGFSVVIDATCLKQNQRALFRDLAQRRDVPFQLFVLENSPTVLERRIRARQSIDQDLSDADVAVLHLQLESRESLREEELASATFINEYESRLWQPVAEWLQQTEG